LNIVLNVILIPPYGAVGSAWATVFTEAAVNGLALWAVFKALHFRPAVGRAVRTVIAAAMMTGVVLLAAQAGLVAGLLIAAPAYLGALIGLRALTIEEIRAIVGRERDLLESA
jgi:O-antigen/teichoic acid export membrane protein